ncbi:MAG: putative metal-dependent rane protease [Patescibacteria group bacterium]|nr:putative metal-dependent rane protease [Patescibacteria group bacterium]
MADIRPHNLHLPVPWDVRVPIGFILLYPFAAISAFAIVFGVLFAMPRGLISDFLEGEGVSLGLLGGVVVLFQLLMLGAIIFWRRKKGIPWKQLGLISCDWPQVIRVSWPFAIYLVLLFFLVSLTSGGVPTSLGRLNDNGWLLLPGLAVFGPIAEEIIFRGLLLPSLVERFGEKRAVLWSSAIFGIVHIHPVQAVVAFFGGLFYAKMRLRTGSIVPGIILHMVNNIIATMGLLSMGVL